MALTVTLSLVDSAIIAGRPTTFQVTVANTSSSSVTLQSLVVSESKSDAIIAQPNFLTPQVALGLGNPTITASGSVSYTFDVVFPAPNFPAPSVNAPMGINGVSVGQPANSTFTLQAVATASDASVGSTTLVASVLSTIAPFPLAQGGALQFSQGFNLINGIIMGVL